MGVRAVLCVLLLAGCGGTSDPGQKRGDGLVGPSPLEDGTAGMQASLEEGMAGEAAMPTDFGNTEVTAPEKQEPLPPEVVEEMTCPAGQRCADTKPDGDCGSLTLEAEVETTQEPGNLLLVFDRSGSMDDPWGAQPRWQAAGTAIEAALSPMVDLFTAGAVFFPSPEVQCVDPTGIACAFVPGLARGCGVNPIADPDQIDFLQGPACLGALTAMPQPFAPVQGGHTPLTAGLREAQAALGAATLTGATAVVVITDGEPNCSWDQAASRQIISDWQAQGTNTYIIGLPGSDGASAVLDDLAMAGGTGMHIPPDDPAALQQRRREIVEQTGDVGFDPCIFNIDPPAEVPDKLHLVVKEGGQDQDVPRDLGPDAGWTISGDGSVAELTGNLCAAAEDGRYESIRFEFGCVDLPPLEPPPPPVVD